MIRTISITALFLLTAACVADDHPAVVKIKGGCTAVCVSPAGLIMTAKHCGTPKNVTVDVGGREVAATLVYVGKDAGDAPVVYDMDGDGYAFAPVGSKVPSVDDSVYCVGYPGGDTENKVVLKGKLTGTTVCTCGQHLQGGFVVDFQSMHGMSGCPLFNSQGQVIGLLHGGNPKTTSWIPFAAIRRAYEAVAGKELAVSSKPILYVLTYPDGQCPACDRFKADVRAGHFERYQVEYITFRDGRWDKPGIAAAVRAATGEAKPDMPAFWPKGSRELRVGYEPKERNAFVAWLDGIARALIRLPEAVVGISPPENPPSPPPSVGPPTPARKQDADGLRSATEFVYGYLRASVDARYFEEFLKKHNGSSVRWAAYFDSVFVRNPHQTERTVKLLANPNDGVTDIVASFIQGDVDKLLDCKQGDIINFEGTLDIGGTYLFVNRCRLIDIVSKDSQPQPTPGTSTPLPDAEVDWSAVTFIALASDATPKLARFLKGPAKRAVETLSKGKAALVVVAERTKPTRYQAVVEAANVNPSPLFLLVLAEKQHLGLKGLVVKVVEGKAAEFLGEHEKLPVEVIFQRTHKSDFAAIKAAIETVEPSPFVRAEESVIEPEPPDFSDISAVIVAEQRDAEPPVDEPKDEGVPWYAGLVAVLAPLVKLWKGRKGTA